MANRSEFTELLTARSYGWMWETYNTFDPVYPKIFDVKTSVSGQEKNTTGIGMGRLTERAEGDPIIESNSLEGYTVVAKNRTFSDSFSMTAEFVDDTPKEKIANIMQDLAGSWGEGVMATKEAFAADFFNYGGLTAGHDNFNGSQTGGLPDPTGDLCYDSKPFFNLSGNLRTAKNGSTYYNGVALSLSDTNLKTLYQLMTTTNNRNERGEIVSIKPNVLLIPPALRFTAKAILESDKVLGSGNNDINTAQNILQPIEWEYLTDTDAWFPGMAKKGLRWYDRKQPVIDFYQHETNKKFYATIDARWGAEMNNWRFWGGSNFATS